MLYFEMNIEEFIGEKPECGKKLEAAST